MKKLFLFASSIFVGICVFCMSVTNVFAASREDIEKFIDEIKDYSMELAYDNDLYASVMIAQAILESGSGLSTLSANDNNLFGVKGTYKGKYTRYWTYEWDSSANKGKGGYIQIKAAFRKYPSYKESLEDYVILLRNGIGNGAEDFYKPTWKSETESWEDAAFYLQGTYATDPVYFKSLSNLINEYDLTQYDVSIEEYYKRPGDFIMIPREEFMNVVFGNSNMFNFDNNRIELNTKNISIQNGLFSK